MGGGGVRRIIMSSRANMVYVASSRTARATVRPCLIKMNKLEEDVKV